MGCTAALALAAALIAQPPSAGSPPWVPGKFLRAYSITCEVLDPRENHWNVPWASEQQHGYWLNDLRAWHRNLADAPRLLESCRWPPAAVSAYYCEVNRRHGVFLFESLSAMTRFDSRYCLLEGWLDENRELGWVWDCARRCKEESHTLTCERRSCLSRLRELLPWEDWATGRLPPPVPLWRFRRLD